MSMEDHATFTRKRLARMHKFTRYVAVAVIAVAIAYVAFVLAVAGFDFEPAVLLSPAMLLALGLGCFLASVQYGRILRVHEAGGNVSEPVVETPDTDVR